MTSTKGGALVCRDLDCRATSPNVKPATIDTLPADVQARVRASGFENRIVFCMYCGSVSAGSQLLGHRATLATEEMRWINVSD